MCSLHRNVSVLGRMRPRSRPPLRPVLPVCAIGRRARDEAGGALSRQPDRVTGGRAGPRRGLFPSVVPLGESGTALPPGRGSAKKRRSRGR